MMTGHFLNLKMTAGSTTGKLLIDEKQVNLGLWILLVAVVIWLLSKAASYWRK